MGYELRREVRAVLPPGGLTPLERHLVLELADLCGDKSREGWPGSEVLQLLIDKNERTVEATLKSIGQKWVELRVEIGKGKDGRPYYSHRGKRTTYRFPKHAELVRLYEKATGNPWASSAAASLPGATRKKSTGNPGASDQMPPTFPQEAPDFSGESPRESRGPSPQSSTPQNFNTSSLSARTSVPAPRDPADDRERDDTTSSEDPNLTEQQQIVINDGSCPPHLSQLVVEYTELTHEVRTIAWWRRVKRHGDTPRIVREALNALPDNIDSTDDFTRDDTPCPLHPHCRARNCQSCWGDVKAGQDPYRHRPELRPAWFKEAYNLQPRTSQRGPDGTRVNRPDGARATGHRQDAPPGYTRRPDGRLVLTDSHNPNINWDAKL